MARIVMLPRPKDPEHDWPQTSTFFALDYPPVHQNLGPDEDLAAEGIPSPWAQMLLRVWRLQNQAVPSGLEAVGQLQVILLLQFLGYLEGEIVRLTPGDQGFGRLAKVIGLLGGDSDQILFWRGRGLPELEDRRVVAGSRSACIFFPAADVNLEDLKRALLKRHGPGSKRQFLDAMGRVTEPAFGMTLAEYLAALGRAAGNANWGIALGSWEADLRELGGRAVPTAHTGLVLPGHGVRDRLEFRRWVDMAPWDCPLCVENGRSWMNFSGPPQRLSAANGTVLCSEHRVPIRKESGTRAPVGYTDFGSHLEQGVLYVWTDEETWPVPRTRSSEISPNADGTGVVTHYFNRQAVEVHGRLLSRDKVVLASVAWMSRRDGQDPQPVDVPVRAEYVPLLGRCERDDIGRRWLIEFKGRPDIVKIEFPEPGARTPWKTSTILVWPPRRVPHWGIDYVAVSAPQATQLRFRIVSQQENDRFEVSPPLRLLGLYRVLKANIAFIEVGEGTDDGFRPLGLLRAGRAKDEVPKVNQGKAEVVLDFGTSNSAVLWRLPGSATSNFVRSGVLPMDLAGSVCQVTFSEDEFKNLLRAVTVLLQWYPEDGEPKPFVPSLLADPDRSTPGGERCIPPRTWGLKALMGDRPRVVGNLKWGDWNVAAVCERVASYLELLLLPALWDLRKNGVTSWSLKATYPLAFGDNRLATYQRLVNDLVIALSPLTGLELPALEFHSESAAAAALLERGQMTHEMSLDLGGGTMDMAVLVGAAGQGVTGKPPGSVLAADSLPYGGRDFVRAIVTAYAPFLPKILRDQSLPILDVAGRGYDESLANFYVEHLEAIIHQGGAAALIPLLQHPPAGVGGPEFLMPRVDLRLRWEAMLAGLQLYVRRMLQGAIASIPAKGPNRMVSISFNLLGQGWELLRLFDPRVPPIDLLGPRLKAIATAVVRDQGTEAVQVAVQTIPNVRNSKTAVVEGADILPPTAAIRPSSAFLSRALDADKRDTFVGMSLLSGTQEIVPLTMRVRELKPDLRPDFPGDVGYRLLLDQLWAEVPVTEQLEGTTVVQLRERVKKHLIGSARYQQVHSITNVEEHLVLRGQTSFNRAWPPGRASLPTSSLLGDFLVKVWKEVWSKTSL